MSLTSPGRLGNERLRGRRCGCGKGPEENCLSRLTSQSAQELPDGGGLPSGLSELTLIPTLIPEGRQSVVWLREPLHANTPSQEQPAGLRRREGTQAPGVPDPANRNDLARRCVIPRRCQTPLPSEVS